MNLVFKFMKKYLQSFLAPMINSWWNVWIFAKFRFRATGRTVKNLRNSSKFHFQKNISRGLRGSVTKSFFEKKHFAGSSRVYHKFKNIFVRFRGGFATPCSKLELSRTLKNTTVLFFCNFLKKYTHFLKLHELFSQCQIKIFFWKFFFFEKR